MNNSFIDKKIQRPKIVTNNFLKLKGNYVKVNAVGRAQTLSRRKMDISLL